MVYMQTQGARRDKIRKSVPIKDYIPKMDSHGRGHCPYCGKRHVLHAEGDTEFRCDACLRHGDVVDLFAITRGMTADEAISLLSMQVAVEMAPDAPPAGTEVRDITPADGTGGSEKINFV